MLRHHKSLFRSLSTRWMGTSSKGEELFNKVLIANRGEIACRIIKTCKKLGIKTVAVYSEPDIHSVAVQIADEAYCIGPAPSNQSYLSIPKIIDVVKKTGAEAVHPGYGFLSENKMFCEALDEIGVKFIGPGFHAIEAMGDKIESKKIAMDAKVNTIPGFLGVMHDDDEVIKVSREIGYPVMIKASAGGGGKGMRVAYNDEEAKLGFRLSKEEAASSFGDDRIFIEKFIEDPRHIEIQIIADKHGNVVPFPERECSIQRRNQKVIEEAPSMLLDQETREAMGAQAAMLAKAVGYESAGTVEFLCDKNRNFYFLEMNTRLQVEHPITELISGVDLVEQMLRIAAGYKVPEELQQGPIKINGWAMESRVYAEDPRRGFLPSIGRLLTYEEPVHCPGVRCDSGVSEGRDISMFYDPMISKLITHGKDRNECLERMKVALDNYVIRGPGHNVSFLQDVYRHPRFVSGKITTQFIAEEYPDGFSGVQLTEHEQSEMIVSSVIMQLRHEVIKKSISGQSQTTEYFGLYDDSSVASSDLIREHTPREIIPQYRVINPDLSAEQVIELFEDDSLGIAMRPYYVSIDGPFGETMLVRSARLFFDKKELFVSLITKGEKTESVIASNVNWKARGPIMKVTMNDSNRAFQCLKELPEGFQILAHGAIHDVVVRTPQEQAASKYMLPKPEVDTSKLLQCPMPGMLISVAVEEGQMVEVGQELCVVEAMKMQNVLRAEKKGQIRSIHQATGASLKVDEIIMEFD